MKKAQGSRPAEPIPARFRVAEAPWLVVGLGSMTAATKRSLEIVARRDGAGPLGKKQQRFNKLVKKVAELKQTLVAWSRAAPELQRTIAECRRLYDERRAVVAELVRLLDRALEGGALTRSERTRLRAIVCDTTWDLLETGADEDLKAIYNRHARGDFDAESASENAMHVQAMKMMIEGFGLDLGDADISTLEDLQKAAVEQAERTREVAEARKARRKKSPKQVASEVRRETERVQVGKALQEVYRRLAMALHPDLEQDPDERARKTQLMQEVNLAYERKDLLQLLELQLRFEQVDQAQLSTLAEDRLDRFNSLLAEQVAQLQQELFDVEHPWRLMVGVLPPAKLAAARVQASALREQAGLARDLVKARHDLVTLQDPRSVKRWLREQVIVPSRGVDGFAGHGFG